jgi:hypothetical protein
MKKGWCPAYEKARPKPGFTIPPRGAEQSPKSQCTPAKSPKGAAKFGADPDLAAVIEAWPGLTGEMRRVIRTIVREHCPGS